MPYPPPPRTPSGPRRRSLLASAAGAALLMGCSGPDSGDGGGSSSVSARTRARAAGDSAGLLSRYDAVLGAHPALAGRLRPLRTEVAAHVKAFGGGTATGSPSPKASSNATSKTSAPASGTASPSSAPTVPTTAKDALASLASAERALADRRAKDLLEVPGELARLMASVAAAGAAHAYLLTEGAR
ncbi:hypothetical protein ACGFYV_33710 [Streptomyces sp. NPDC048297]|uniref:hypothetical protein n=1 Tax=Streptomyces sp. NPDC048297 TaxID=3365531 RepID=UPI0037184765